MALLAIAAAALPADVLALEDLAAAPAGAWVEYEVRAAGGPPVFVRLAALGADPGGGRWVELWISSRPGSASQVYRALIAGGGVRRLLVRLGAGSVQELPAPAAPAPPASCEGPRCRARVHERALGRVRTRAGAFPAFERVVRTGGARARLRTSPEVPLGGVLRLEVQGVIAELVGTGRNARSAIPPGVPVTPAGEVSP